MDWETSTLTYLDILLARWDENLEGARSQTAEELCRDRPELASLLDRAILERELTRLGVPSVATAPSLAGSPDAIAPLPSPPDVGVEPVPGYRLLARIGVGGSGEVWRAAGPGGVALALKLIRIGEEGPGVLDLTASDVRALRSRRDCLRSLELMRAVRHPNLLTFFGAWESHGYLVVGMELADGTLGDRLDASLARGHPGIPAPELMGWMAQAAGGIDHLNGPRHVFLGREGMGIQHRDIKPQNLLLLDGVVKLGDFGLAKLLEDSILNTGSLTPAYAAPEFFRGKPSRHSDQYSLGVTYCQLRGGRLPFEGSQWEVMMGHCRGEPDLSMLPEAERPAVARALAKDPALRWPDCVSFVEAIAAGSPLAGPRPSSARRRRRLAALVVIAATLAGLALSSAQNSRPPAHPDTSNRVAAKFPGLPGDEGLAAGPVTKAPDDVRPPGPIVAAEFEGPAESGTDGRPETPPVEEPPLIDLGIEPNRHPDPARAWRRLADAWEEGRRLLREAVAVQRAEMDRRRANGPANRDDEERPEFGPEMALPPVPKTSTIFVRMPGANSELVVRGEVGKGEPDEWYGPTRVIHTPPLKEGGDYRVGAFWMGPSGAPVERSRALRVEPGRLYEVDLTPARPTWRELEERPKDFNLARNPRR